MTGPAEGESPSWHCLSQAFRQSPVPTLLASPAGALRWANRAFRQWLGHGPGDAVPDTLHASLHALAAQPGTEPWLRDLQAGGGGRARRAFRHRDGRPLWAEITASLLPEAAGGPLLLLQLRDITAELERERHLVLCETALDHAANAVTITDERGRIEWVNQAFTRLTGYSSAEVVGRTPAMLKSGVQDRGFYREMWGTLSQGHVFSALFVNRRKDSGLYHARQTIAPVMGEGSRPTHYIAVQEDVTAQHEAEQRLLHLTRHDPLTGLPNRVRCAEWLEAALAREGAAAVAVLDLTRFGTINDALGHPVGDRLLQAAAARLSEALEAGEQLARIGGDEFAVVQGRGDLAALARRLGAALRAPLRVDGLSVPLEACIGLALAPEDGRDAATLLHAATLAMREARKGGSPVRFFSAGLDRQARERAEIEAGLRRAVARGEIVLHYQPQVSLEDGRIVGLEALARWQHPERGMVPPGVFIPVAEATGLIIPLGGAVLETAVAQAASWRRAGRPVRVAVNVSVAQFAAPGFVEGVAALLRHHALPPGLLELELTESLLAEDMEAASRVVQALQALGCSLAIDDFGTGYSSLASLRRFRTHCLKLDRAFLADAEGAPILRAVATLGRELGMRVLAEGVETEEQAEMARAIGCHEGQGWLFGRPVPGEAVEPLLAR